jgi:carboxymethylenebutenolidase
MSVRPLELSSGTAATIALAPGSDTVVVIAPDIFGLRPLFNDMAQRFATQWGVTAIAVEPFAGLELGDEVEPRLTAVKHLSDERHLDDLHLGIDAAASAMASVRRVGLIGFCMGGMYCFNAARSERFDRIASFYGMIRLPVDWAGPGHREPLDHLAAGHPDRVLALVGDLDPYTPPDDVAALGAAGVNVVRYPEAEHGFAHDPERPAHRRADAANAWSRARDWLVH